MPSPKLWWLYLLRCQSGRLYTGISRDVARRTSQHARGRGAQTTRNDPMVEFIGSVPVGSRAQAMRVEKTVKGWSPARKHTFFRALAPTHELPADVPAPRPHFDLAGAIDCVERLDRERDDAIEDVWAQLAASQRGLASILLATGQSSYTIARWLTANSVEFGVSPAAHVASGNGADVAASVVRALLGVK